MTTDDLERKARQVAAEWAFIRRVLTLDKTAHALKMRLYVFDDRFIQVYANIEKRLLSYTLVFDRTHIYGRDSESGRWHRHPYNNPETHDFGIEGSQPVDLAQFLGEVQQILEDEALL